MWRPSYPDKSSIQRELLAIKRLIMDKDEIEWVTGRERFNVEKKAVLDLFRPNSVNWKGVTTLVFFCFWGFMWASSFYFPDRASPTLLVPLTGLIMLIAGRWWGVEVAIAGVKIPGLGEVTVERTDDNE